MCDDCVSEYGGLAPYTSKMEGLSILIREFYKWPGCETGGPLHVATDDYNLEDSSLAFCRKSLESDGWWLQEHLIPAGVDIAVWRNIGRMILDGLEQLSVQERATVVHRAWFP